MNLEQIKIKIKESDTYPIEIDNYYSVLVPLVEINKELHLLYQVRSHCIARQPGEISFPGGQVENNESFVDAAVRETHEEIGLAKENIEILGSLNYVIGKSGFIIYPYLGYLNNCEVSKLQYSKEEVNELFTVPLDFLLNKEPEKHYIQFKPDLSGEFPFHLIQNGKDYNWHNIKYPVYFYKYNQYIIWGITAKITYNFIKKLKHIKVKSFN